MSPSGRIDPACQELVRRLRAGDERGWEQFIRRYRKLIYSAIHRVNVRYSAGWDEPEMDEIFEDALYKLLRNEGKALAAWQGRCKLETWVYRIVRNVCVDHLRRASRRPSAAAEEPRQELERASGGAFATERRTRDLRISLEQAIERVLTPREAIAVRLIYFEGFTYREVADRFRMSVGAMSGMVYRALSKLRDQGDLAGSAEGGRPHHE